MDKHTTIAFQDTGYFTKIIYDYLDRNKNLDEFYGNDPNIAGFGKQIALKKESFTQVSRNVLVSSLIKQYHNFDISSTTEENVQSLKEQNTFTVTTGHQLNLFTGPLYFLYKIVSTINLSKRLKKEFPNSNFVPVYWMATEDHDFEEIQYFNFKNNKISWQRSAKGAVGRLCNEGLNEVFETFSAQLNTSKTGDEVRSLFENAYLKHDNLTDATRYLANTLFGKYGLVIIDGDDIDLKKQFSPFVENELLNQSSYKKVKETISGLEKSYKIQVNPREINLFYLDDALRERIVFENGVYKVNNTNLVFTKDEILKELELSPEKFSPNVIMRPLYQEVVMPNLCYIGGGGELAYWFELKRFFESQQVPFPILLLRNSVLVLTRKQFHKMEKLNITLKEIFKNQHKLIDGKIKEISDVTIDFSEQKNYLEDMFKKLENLSNYTDKSFLGAVKAQEKKQLKGISNLEKRLLKAQKRKYKEIVGRITTLQNELFPNQSLQERQVNFSEFYQEYGQDLIEDLIACLDPLKLEFDVLKVS